MGTQIRRILIVSIGFLVVGFSAPTALLADSIADFECEGTARHIFTNLKPTVPTYKLTEHYCETPNGQRQGLTKISVTDYDTGESPWTYTMVGQYRNGKRVGQWVTTDATGQVIGKCFYANGNLKKGDPSLCPK